MTRESIKLDEKDRKIITLLHDEQEISQDEIARIVNLSQPSVAIRIKKLKEKVHRKEEVIAWLTEENIKLKKTPGDL